MCLDVLTVLYNVINKENGVPRQFEKFPSEPQEANKVTLVSSPFIRRFKEAVSPQDREDRFTDNEKC